MEDHKQQFCEFIKADAKEAKQSGKSLKDYLPFMSRLVREWQQEFPDAPTYEEGRTIAEEVYGLRLPKPAPAVITSVKNLLAKEVKEKEVLLEVKSSGSDVIHHPSLGEIHAFRGVGKTNFCFGMSSALATAGDFLCYQATRQFKVLYIEGELDESDLHEQLELLAKENENFQLVARCEQSNEFMASIATMEGLTWYEEAITRTKAEVVIFDNWSRLANVGTNDEESFFQFTEWCVRMRLRGVTVIYLHHDGKDKKTQRGHSKPEDPLNWVIGLRWSDNYTGSEGLRCILEFEKCRRPVYEFSKISIELRDGVWCWGKDAKSMEPTTGRPPVEMTDEQRTTLKTLLEARTGERTIAKEMDVSRDLVRKWKAELLGKKPPRQEQIAFDANVGAEQ